MFLQDRDAIDLVDKEECQIRVDARMREKFRRTKTAIGHRPILAIPNNSEEFFVYSNASKNGIGYVLMENEKVIIYTCR